MCVHMRTQIYATSTYPACVPVHTIKIYRQYAAYPEFIHSWFCKMLYTAMHVKHASTDGCTDAFMYSGLYLKRVGVV